ncbi:MAG: tripartite tricarboxylate transporter permease [Eubacteriaceae bacterium]
MNIFTGVFFILTNPEQLFFLGLFVFLGIYIGAIPGLSVTMACSLLISFTYTWDPLIALVSMVGVYVGGVYGGSRSAILLNVPGCPASIATGFDGYPLAKKGLAGKAISITIVMSFIGGIIGTLFLAFAAPFISNIALKFGPNEYLLLGFMGLLLIGSMGEGSMVRGLLAGLIGLLVGTIGLDFATGQQRFTFGNIYLMGGIHYVVVMIGLFGMSEALYQLRYLSTEIIKQRLDNLKPEWGEIKKHFPLTLRSSVLGTFIGALPGTGGDIASLIAYDQAKRTIKNPETPFGEGAIEGLVSTESANNAAIGGVYIPMLTLGIPGDAVTAVILGALMIHGFEPGPLFLDKSPEIFSLIVGGNLIGNIFLLIFGFMGIKLFAKIVEIPKYILMPLIIILSIIGAFAINSNIADIYWMMAFGIFGYFLKLYYIPIAPVILGIILCPVIENNFRRGLALANESIPLFIWNMLTGFISFVLLFIIIFMIISQTKFYNNIKNKIVSKLIFRNK